MTFVMFLWFCFASIGLTNIMVHGTIFDVIKLRPWLKEKMKPEHFQVFECYECSGFWAGMFCGLFFLPFGWYLLLPVCGFTGSFLGKTYTDLMLYVESKIDFEIGSHDETEEN